MSKDSNSKKDILAETDYGMSKARSPLARLFRKILFDFGVTSALWRTMMTNFVENPANHSSGDSTDINSLRGNTNKELRKPNMTMRVFQQKAIPLLGAVEAELEVRLKFPNGQVTSHTVPFYKRPPRGPITPVEAVVADNMTQGPVRVAPETKVMDMSTLLERIRKAKENKSEEGQGPT